MPTVTALTHSPTPTRARHVRGTVLARVTLAWSLTIGVASLLWATDLLSFPFGDYGTSLLDRVSPGAALATLATAAVAGVVLSLAHLRVRRPSRALAATTVLLAVVLVFAIPDWRVLAAVGYTPIAIVAVVIGAQPISLFANIWSVPTLVLASGMLAGLGFAILATRSWPPARRKQLTTKRLHAIGVTATSIAALIPVGYAVTRICWALGIAFGISGDFLEKIHGITVIGLGLALFAILGAALTLGLVQRWGTVFPRWVPGLRGTPVPVNLAVVPALVVAVLVASAGVNFIRDMISGSIAMAPAGASGQTAAWLPEMFWPLWGIALATAALVYRERRRRGDSAPSVSDERAVIDA